MIVKIARTVNYVYNVKIVRIVRIVWELKIHTIVIISLMFQIMFKISQLQKLLMIFTINKRNQIKKIKEYNYNKQLF